MEPCPPSPTPWRLSHQEYGAVSCSWEIFRQNRELVLGLSGLMWELLMGTFQGLFEDLWFVSREAPPVQVQAQ
jgi:hypothetical protein